MATLIVTEDLAAPASIGRGGHTAYMVQWLRGLERLGHRVIFVEFLKSDPGEEGAAGVEYFRQTMRQWWHEDQCSLMVEPTRKCLFGLDAAAVARGAAKAAGLMTIAAHYRRKAYPLVDKIRPRILIEQDPGYTHLWVGGGDPLEIFGEHDFYFTVGGNIGTGRSRIPTCGIPWRHTWNPVVMEWWTPGRAVTRDRFTTVGDWRSYGYLEFEGAVLGPKAEEFRKFLELPKLAGEKLGMVLRIDEDDSDLEMLKEHGWQIEPPTVVNTPGLYHDFVEGSLGEFSCAKGGYVGTRGGWFSDRSSCYLAAGRPVILQATGFEDLVPTGRGLFAVKTAEEAAEAVRAIRGDYAGHAAAARRIAEEHFNSDVVLRRVLAEAGIGGA
jgi:hypothetical protein